MSRIPVPDDNTLLLALFDEATSAPSDPVFDYGPLGIHGVYEAGGASQWAANASFNTDRPFVEFSTPDLSSGDIVGNYSGSTDGFRFYRDGDDLIFGIATTDGWVTARCAAADHVLPYQIAGGIDANDYAFLSVNGKVYRSTGALVSAVCIYGSGSYIHVRSAVKNLSLNSVYQPLANFVNAYAASDLMAGLDITGASIVYDGDDVIDRDPPPPGILRVKRLTLTVGGDLETAISINSYPTLTDTNGPGFIDKVIPGTVNKGALSFPGGNGHPIAPSWTEGRHWLFKEGGGPSASGSFTVEALLEINPTMDVVNNAVFLGSSVKGAGDGPPTAWHFMCALSNSSLFHMKDGSGATLSVVGSWHQRAWLVYYVATWNSALKEARVFIDGNQVGKADNALIGDFSFPADFVFGGGDQNGRTFHGFVYNLVFIPGVVKTPKQIYDFFHGTDRAAL